MPDPSTDRWWHGGPRLRGSSWILPPAVTGAELLDAVIHPDDPDAAEAARVRDTGKVYAINDRDLALLFAAVRPDPWLYEVRLVGEVDDDPDFTPDPDLPELRSVRCDAALILRRERPSRQEILDVRRLLLEWFDVPADTSTSEVQP